MPEPRFIPYPLGQQLPLDGCITRIPQPLVPPSARFLFLAPHYWIVPDPELAAGASSRPHLAMTPLPFSLPSAPSFGFTQDKLTWQGDFHFASSMPYPAHKTSQGWATAEGLSALVPRSGIRPPQV
jgi:hypothetical protein